MRISVDGRALGSVTPTTARQVYEFPLGAFSGAHGWSVVGIDTPTFVQSYTDPREFGAMVDWIEIR